MTFKVWHIVFLLIFVGSAILLGCSSNESSPTKESSQSASETTEISEDNNTEATTESAENSTQETEPAVLETPVITDTESAPLPAPEMVTVLVADQITSLDPYRMVTIHPDNSVAVHLWDTLTLLNDNLQIEPHLAESWRLINNFTWEFKLQKNVTFHNGELVNAQAVQFSIERAESLAGSLETFAEDVTLKEVKVVDEYTIQLITRTPVVNMPYHLAFLEILPPIYYAQADVKQLEIAPVGSGPYRLSNDAQPSRELLTLEAVPDYWKGPPLYPKITFKTVSSLQERLIVLNTDEVVLVTDVPPIAKNQWSSNGRLEAIESTQRIFVGLNATDAEPLKNKQVRQALNYGINVEQIVDQWFEGYGERYGSWVNPPANNDKLAPWPYDPKLARQLLADAGYTNGLTLTLRAPAGIYYHDVDVAQTIAQQLMEIGVTVNLEPVSNWGIYARDLLEGNTGALFLLQLNSRGDPLEDTKNLSAQFTFNPTRWQNESFEDILGRAFNTFNEIPRKTLLDEAQAVAYEESPWLWLWRQYKFYGVSQNLYWTPRRDGLINLYKAVDQSEEP